MRSGSTVFPEASVLESGIGADFAGAEKESAPGVERRRRAALSFILIHYLAERLLCNLLHYHEMLTLFCKLQDLEDCNKSRECATWREMLRGEEGEEDI